MRSSEPQPPFTEEADILRPKRFRPEDSQFQSGFSSLADLRQWFSQLTQIQQTAVLLVAALFGLMVLSVLMQLLSLAMRLLILGLIVWLLYRWWDGASLKK